MGRHIALLSRAQNSYLLYVTTLNRKFALCLSLEFLPKLSSRDVIFICIKLYRFKNYLQKRLTVRVKEWKMADLDVVTSGGNNHVRSRAQEWRLLITSLHVLLFILFKDTDGGIGSFKNISASF